MDDGVMNGRNWNENIFALGCHSLSYDAHNDHSVYMSCTDSSYSVAKYVSDDCSGESYGEYTAHNGCQRVDLSLYGEPFSFLSLIEIEECGMVSLERNGANMKKF